jgi:sugar lactone lactonase YvrE
MDVSHPYGIGTSARQRPRQCRTATGRFLSVILLTLLCVACAETSQSRGVPAAPIVSRPARLQPILRSQYLYVSNGLPPHAVAVYIQGESNPIRVIKHGGGGAMAFDSSGNLYASNGTLDNEKISVYAAGTTKLLRTIKDIPALTLAVDDLGYLYVASGGDGIVVFAPDSTELLHVIRRGTKGSVALAFDHTGNLYAANNGSGSVTVYAPSKTPGYPKLVGKIEGLHHPFAFAFGTSANLFVATHKSVYVFKVGSLELLRTITGIRSAAAIAVDSIGRLYVTSTPFTYSGYQTGWVTVYAPGGTKVIRKITDGIDVPKAVAVDADDNVYVANAWNSSVTVYSPGGAKRLRTITSGIALPVFLSFNSQ